MTTPRSFLLPERRDLVDFLVRLFVWMALAAVLYLAARTVYGELHTREIGDGLQFEPIWR